MSYHFHAENTIGVFDERSAGSTFEYRISEDGWGKSHDLPHEIFVGDGTRAARVLKTVAYVAIDEGADGSPVLERWEIRRHSVHTS